MSNWNAHVFVVCFLLQLTYLDDKQVKTKMQINKSTNAPHQLFTLQANQKSVIK